MTETAPRLSVTFTIAFDALCLWISKGGGAGAVSRGEVGPVAVGRLLDLFERNDVTTTFWVPGHSALAYPDIVRKIDAAGHEIGHHGWVHENAGKGDIDERVVFERGLEALDRVAGIRPVGYRATGNNFDFSRKSVGLMREYGFEYSSSCFGHDYYAYYLREGDERPVDGAYVFGRPTDIVEVPNTWGLVDINTFEFVPGYSNKQASTVEAEALWREEFDYAYENAPGGILNFPLHDQVIGRGPRVKMLGRLIEYMKRHDGVVFEPLRAYAARWGAANPLDQWLKDAPTHSGINAIRLDGSSASLYTAGAAA